MKIDYKKWLHDCINDLHIGTHKHILVKFAYNSIFVYAVFLYTYSNVLTR